MHYLILCKDLMDKHSTMVNMKPTGKQKQGSAGAGLEIVLLKASIEINAAPNVAALERREQQHCYQKLSLRLLVSNPLLTGWTECLA